ncbi:hypothetical protein CHARACLAT_004332 [Characodon lateralis]|uniref:Uncharacterized protein n=1 Tax=Characodon lateralis TaxID=208331 RepID=A0ABU7CNL2_9TELE|nr:hypothetical protein [Characodon lateralis]
MSSVYTGAVHFFHWYRQPVGLFEHCCHLVTGGLFIVQDRVETPRRRSRGTAERGADRHRLVLADLTEGCVRSTEVCAWPDTAEIRLKT